MIRHHLTGSIVPRTAARLAGIPFRVDTGGKRIAYLTYDDGPSPSITAPLASLLNARGCTATFFMLGKMIDQHSDTLLQIRSLGHLTALHGYEHIDPWRTSIRYVIDDYHRSRETYERVVSDTPALYRPPYGRVRPSLVRDMRRTGVMTVMWDLLAGDYEPSADAADVASYVIRYIRPGSIVVLHDGIASGRLALDVTRRLLDALQPDGWSFESLDL